MKLLCICLLAVIQLSHQKSTPEADTYKAAVVEFAPLIADTVNATIAKNSKRYVDYIKEAAALDVDIIVFPELGLTSSNLPPREYMESWSAQIPDNYNPRIEDETAVHQALKAISSTARDGKIYVVINIFEKLPCAGEECPKDGKFFFNSLLVFDRDGKIIAKYRKTHLFNEPHIDILPTPEVSTFDTDFNVTFGMIICSDITFKEPALNLTRIHNVTDIVFSTNWFSQLPFLTGSRVIDYTDIEFGFSDHSNRGGYLYLRKLTQHGHLQCGFDISMLTWDRDGVQVQAEWAYAEDVNLLGAGTNKPEWANSGSGIYLGRKGVKKATIGTPGDKILISDVPKKNRKLLTASIKEACTKNSSRRVLQNKKSKSTNSIGFGIFRDDHLVPATTTYESRLMYSPIKQQKLCQKEFCCVFTIETSSLDPYSVYRLMVMDDKTKGAPTMDYQACGIILCKNDYVINCGVTGKSETTFSMVEIAATFVNRQNRLILPSSINSSFLPLDWTYNEKIEGDKIHINAVLNKPAKNVLTLGLWARKFEND